MQSNPDEADIPGVVGRRSARLSIIVPVTLRGTDASGQSFKENTWTISVNKHGGRIATFHLLANDDQIVIENPLLGRTAKARVSRVCERRFAEDPYEVCVELLEAQNVWGVKLPPEDWQKERQVVPGEQKSTSPQAAPQAREISAATPEKDQKAEISHFVSQGSPAEAGERTGGLSQFNMAVNALSRFAGEAGGPPAQIASPRQEGTGVPKAPAADLLAFKSLQEKIEEAQSLRQEMSVLADRVQSARAEVESLLSKASAAGRDVSLEAEQVAQQIEEASGAKLQSVLSRLDREIEQKLGSASARWAGETEQRLQAGAAGVVESVTKELGERLPPLAQESLSKAVLEFQAECKRAAEKARAELDALVKEATAAAEAGTRKATEEVSPSLSAQMERAAEEAGHRQLETFKAQIESARKSDEDSIRHSLEGMRQEIQAETADRVQSARAEVEDLLSKASAARRDVSLEAEQVARQIEEASGAKLQSVLSRLDQEIEQKLGSASARWAGETEQRLQAGAAGVVESVTKELGERLPPLAQESLSKAVLEFQAECKRAAEKARAELDALVKEATAAAEAGTRKATEEVSPSLSAQMERAAEEVGRRQLEAFKAQIESARKSGEDSIRHSLEGMRQEIQAEALNAGIHARKICKEESGTAAKAISVCVDSAVDSLNRAGDEAAAKLQAARQTLELGLKKTAEEYLPRLAGESASMLEKFRAEAQALGAQLQSEVGSTAREFSEKAGREISEKLEGTVEGALELVAREFNKQGEDALELLKEGLRSAQEQCVEETRKHLAVARQSTLTSLESEAGAMSASFREQLHTTLLEMVRQQRQEMEAAIQASLQGLLESLRTKIQLTADESAARVTAEIRSGAEQAFQELPDRLYKGVGMAALVAREWEEQAKTHLEAHSHQLLEIFQKQLEALTATAQERQRTDAEALRTLLQGRLNQAAQLFEGLTTDAGQAKETAREEPESPPAQSLPASPDTSQPVLEPLVDKQRQIVEELLGAFRSKLNQILAGESLKE